MGYFGEIWIMQPREVEGEVKNFVEHSHFKENAYFSWEGANLSEKEWIPKAEQTIFIRKDGFFPGHSVEHEMKNVTTITWGLFQKTKKYTIETNLTGQVDAGFCLLHIVLPELYVPEEFLKSQPAFIKKIGHRVAMTWAFHHHVSVSFRFRKVDLERFGRYEAVGGIKIVKVDPRILQTAKTAAEYAGILTKLAVNFTGG
jgi:hypothetical protein